MKLFELHSSDSLKLRVDNPGGDWLKYKREDNTAAGTNRFGSPARFGPVTGYWNRPVLLPIDVAAKIKGINGEQSNVRPDSFKAIKGIMGSTQKLPRSGENDEHQYAPFITVYQDGSAWVSEGNHRIMVAKHLGWEYIPIEVRYFSGGEKEEGPLTPAKVREWDAEALEKGHSPTDYQHQ